MELDDLKTAWKSIENEIEHVSTNDTDEIMTNRKRDVKSSLIIRFRWGIAVLALATVLLGTSRLWAGMKMPMWWIGAFCILFIAGIAVTTLLIQRISNINLGEDTPQQVMQKIISVKRTYRLTELYGSTIILGLTVAGVLCSPIPYKPSEIVIISIVTVICYLTEYLTFRSNIKKISRIQSWLKEP